MNAPFAQVAGAARAWMRPDATGTVTKEIARDGAVPVVHFILHPVIHAVIDRFLS